MLSIQKCPTDKTGLRYVPSSTYDTPSTSKTILVKPVIPEPPPSCVDKGKLLWKEKFQLSLSLWPNLLSEEILPHAITVVSSNTSDLTAHIGKLRGRQIGRVLKLPRVTNMEFAVMSNLRSSTSKEAAQASWTFSQKSYSKASVAPEAYSSKEDFGP
jgi:hypothetical protein